MTLVLNQWKTQTKEDIIFMEFLGCFLFKVYFIFNYAYVYVGVHVSISAHGVHKMVGPRTEVIGLLASWCRCWDPNCKSNTYSWPLSHFYSPFIEIIFQMCVTVLTCLSFSSWLPAKNWMTYLHCLQYNQFQRRKLFRLLHTLCCPYPPSHLETT